jgi:multiple sugar transport system permease protein
MSRQPHNSGFMGGPGRQLRRALVYTTLIAISLVYAAPLLWMLSTSARPADQTMLIPPRLLADPTSRMPEYAQENYSSVWHDPVVNFPLYLRNTLVVSGLAVAGCVISSSIVAYGFARIRWRGRGALFALVLSTMMIPFPVVMAPLYVLFSRIGWVGTFRPLWVPFWFGNAFSIFLLRQFFLTLPKELDEAARIDGCSHWGTFWRIILPLSRPALAVVVLLHFTYMWNDFLAPLIFLTHRDQFTLALGLHLYQSQAGNTPWNLLMAASTMVIAPVLLLFVLTQRTFVQGVAAEGLKE